MAGNEETLQKELREANEREKKLEDELNQMREKLAKDSEFRQLPTAKTTFPIEGRFQWEVELAKTGYELIFSPFTDIGGVPFRLGSKTKMNGNDKRHLVGLFCNDNSSGTTYSGSVACTLKVLSTTTNGGYSEPFHNIITPSVATVGWLETSMLRNMDPLNGRIHNGRITVEAQIRVIWFHKNAITDFTSRDSGLSDVILLVGGKVFHASMNFLAHFSGYFKALSCSSFAENNKDSIELKEVDAAEFEQMLRVIYPERKEVTAATVKGLLRMADFFDVPTVTQECTKFLKTSTDFSLTAKLELAEKFRIYELQCHVVESMKIANDIKELISSVDFGKLSVSLRETLYEKHFKLSPK